MAANGGTVLVVALSFDPVTVVPAELVERTLTIAGSVGFDDELEEALAPSWPPTRTVTGRW